MHYIPPCSFIFNQWQSQFFVGPEAVIILGSVPQKKNTKIAFEKYTETLNRLRGPVPGS